MKPNRQETSIEKVQHIPTLVLRMTVSVILKKKSNVVSSVLVSQKRLETNIQKAEYISTLALPMAVSVIIKK